MNEKATAYIAEAARIHGVPITDVLGYRRGHAYQARLRVMHALDGEGWSSVQIGRVLNRCHTSVLYGLGRLSRGPDAILEALGE